MKKDRTEHRPLKSIIFADNISILGGILSGPIAILGFNFVMILLFYSAKV